MPHRQPSIADRITAAIEHASVLDVVADRIAAAVPDRVRAGRARELASGTRFGHPAHPGIVAVPMGAWISAGVLDVVGGRAGRRSARRLVGVGVLTAAPAALTGWSDWFDTEGAERRVGLAHAAANGMAISLYAGSWAARVRGRQARGVALALLGSAVLSAAGWLGGHLTFALGVGVDTTAFQHMDPEWADVGPAGDVEVVGARLNGVVQGTPVLVLRTGSGLVAMADRCTHRGAHCTRGRSGTVVCSARGTTARSTWSPVRSCVARRPDLSRASTSGLSTTVYRCGAPTNSVPCARTRSDA